MDATQEFLTTSHRMGRGARARDACALLAARCVRWMLRSVARRGGSALPGLVADWVSPRLLPRTLASFPRGVVVVTGSSGKSTTTRMLTSVLREHGMTVFTNPSTANMRRGIISAIVDRSRLPSGFSEEIAVLELDEPAAARLAADIEFRLVVVTNVMSDQLDRFHAPDIVAGHIGTACAGAAEIVANGDDGMVQDALARVVGSVRWFGAASTVRPSTSLGFGFARDAEVSSWVRNPATVVVSTTGTTAVLNCHGDRISIRLPARGVHYAADAAAALEAARALLGGGFSLTAVIAAFDVMEPVFGRGEVVTLGGEDVELVLVQNIASFQLNIDQLDSRSEQLLVAVGSDVADPSWLWSVNLSTLPPVSVVSGSRAHDVALRMAYEGIDVDEVDADLQRAIRGFLARPRPANGHKTIVFTADPMRRVRRMLGLAEGATR